MTVLAVLLVGIWLIIHSQASTPPILTLIFGLVVAALAVADLLGARFPRP